MATFSSHPLRMRKAFVLFSVGGVLELLGFLHQPMWTRNHVAEGFAVTGIVAEIAAVIVLIMYMFLDEYKDSEKLKLAIAVLSFFGAIFMVPGAAIPNPPSISPVPLALLVIGIIVNILTATILFLDIANINFDALYQGILAQRQAFRQRRKKNKVHCESAVAEEKIISSTAVAQGESENTVVQICNETIETDEPNINIEETPAEKITSEGDAAVIESNVSEKNSKNVVQESSSVAEKNSIQSPSNQEVDVENTISDHNASQKISKNSVQKATSKSSRNSTQSKRCQKEETASSNSPILDLAEIRQVSSLTEKQSKPTQANTSKDNVKTGSDIDVMIRDS